MEGSGKMQLLDRYRSRFGQAVKRQGNGWNGPCPLCGGEPGKSDRFMVWPERSDNLGEACAKNGISGIWSCRQCGASGDTIAYLTKIDGLTFKEALGELGIEPTRMPWRRRRAPVEPARIPAWEPKYPGAPSTQWQEHALKLVETASQNIWNFPQALKWLAARGISEDAVKSYRLGYLAEESQKHHGRFRPRKAFGLPSKTGQDGKVHDKLFIPRGIVIPTFSASGEVLNLRIRRHKTDLQERAPKYMELEGSSHGAFFLQSSQPLHLGVYFITEAELDAMLIHHVSGGVVGAVAVRTNRGKPDARCHPTLEAAARICIALDYDQAGAEGCDFWEENYSTCVRWPTPEGKDPGDAFALGVDIREWIEASLPASVRLPDKEGAAHGSSITQVNQGVQEAVGNGHVEACPSGQDNLGGGASPDSENEKGNWPSKARAKIHARAMAADWSREICRWEQTQPKPFPWASEADFTANELGALQHALPKGMPLDMVWLDVAVIWLLWRFLPVTYWSEKNGNGDCVRFGWEFPDKLWHEDRFLIFWRYQQTSRALWRWLSDHPASRINAKNLLHLWNIPHVG